VARRSAGEPPPAATVLLLPLTILAWAFRLGLAASVLAAASAARLALLQPTPAQRTGLCMRALCCCCITLQALPPSLGAQGPLAA